jgi:hypothetical protein
VKPAKDEVTDSLVLSARSDHHTAEVRKKMSQRRDDRRQNTSLEKGTMLIVTYVPQDLSRVDADKKHASKVKKRAKQVNQQRVSQ